MSCEEWLETGETPVNEYGAPECPKHGSLVGAIPPGATDTSECSFPTKKSRDKAITRGLVDV